MSANLNAIGPVMLVGAGKMGLALARGWLDAGLSPSNLILVDPAPGPAARELADDYGLTLNSQASGLMPNVLVLAVKPQIIDQVMQTLQPVVGPNTLAISIAAGIDIARLCRELGTDRVVRAMPNTPAQIGKGITGLVGGANIAPADRGV
ncbi:MAG: NAD(P)-binding domain-containing protein, partial [Alphaproteobacteria bacterium]|nr:NAD(P)-binding domain-containing protein [Alphaproteobacteria bacterium]